MLQNLKRADNLPPTLEVRVKKCFDPKEGTFGETMNTIVEYNGTEYYLDFKPKSYPMAKEGNKLMLAKKMYDGHPFFEIFLLGGNGQPVAPAQPPLMESDMPWSKTEKDTAQDKRNLRIIKSQMLNLSVELYGHDIRNPVELLDKAKQLFEAFNPWINE